MKVTKRVLALVVAIVMLASVFSVAASALTYTPTLTSGTYKISLVPDKYVVNPGDTVTVSVYVDDSGLTSDFGAWNSAILYNDTQLSPSSTDGPTFRQFMNDATTWLRQTSTVNFNMATTPITRFLTSEEQAYYNHAIFMTGAVDTSLGVGAIEGQGWDPSSPDLPMLQFQMVVSNDVQPGDEIWFGFHDAYYQANVTFLQNCPAVRIPNTELNLSDGMVMLTVASDEPAGPVVAKSRSQVKMTATSDTTVADAFTFRVISTITDADWDTYFANTAAGGDTSAIQRLGFVAYKGTDGFDMETAKAVAQGSATEGYEVAWTDYVQKADDSSDAYFGARLEITSAETRADVTYVGVVEYLNADGTTAYAFYDAAEQALLNTNYDTIVADYLATYPYAG